MPKKKTKKTKAKSISAITSDAQVLGQMIRKRSEKISGKLRYDENDLEQELAINLKKHGIAFTRQFKVPTQKGKERIVDLYISAPIRAFIEIKLVPTDIDGNPVDIYPAGSGLSFPSRMERQIKDLYFRFFDKSITCILVTNVKFHKMIEEQLQNQLDPVPIRVISLPKSEPKPGRWCAEKIRNDIAHGRIPLRVKTFRKDGSKNIFEKQPLEIGQFSDILSSFRTILEKSDFQILKTEIKELNDEIESKHFISSALRVGRTMEFVIYTLARAWGVSINERTNDVVQTLEDSYSKYNKKLIEFSYAENETDKEKTKKELRKLRGKLFEKLNNSISDLDNKGKTKKRNIKINSQTIVNDIKRKYARIHDVRESLKNIKTKAMPILLKYRNAAAHAKIGDEKIDIGEKEIEIILEQMRFILFSLSNIAHKILDQKILERND